MVHWEIYIVPGKQFISLLFTSIDNDPGNYISLVKAIGMVCFFRSSEDQLLPPFHVALIACYVLRLRGIVKLICVVDKQPLIGMLTRSARSSSPMVVNVTTPIERQKMPSFLHHTSSGFG